MPSLRRTAATSVIALLTAASSLLESDVSSWPHGQALERKVAYPVVNLDDRYRTTFQMEGGEAYRRMGGLARRSGFEESWLHVPSEDVFYEVGFGNEFKVYKDGLVTRYNSESSLFKKLASSCDELVYIHFHPSSRAVSHLADRFRVLEGSVHASSKKVALNNLGRPSGGGDGLDVVKEALGEAFSSNAKAAPSLPDLTALIHYAFLVHEVNPHLDYSHIIASEKGLTRFRLAEEAYAAGSVSIDSLFTDGYLLAERDGRIILEDKYFSISFEPFDEPLPDGRVVTFYKDYLNRRQGTKPF
ncbi:MAG: hypothetical protein ACLFO2_01830 [Candidatus Woesearchaeota archaeon]